MIMEETLHWWSLRGKVWQRNGGRYYVDSLFEDPSQVLSHPSYHNVRVNTSSPGLSVTVLDILEYFHFFFSFSEKYLALLILRANSSIAEVVLFLVAVAI